MIWGDLCHVTLLPEDLRWDWPVSGPPITESQCMAAFTSTLRVWKHTSYLTRPETATGCLWYGQERTVEGEGEGERDWEKSVRAWGKECDETEREKDQNERRQSERKVERGDRERERKWEREREQVDKDKRSTSWFWQRESERREEEGEWDKESGKVNVNEWEWERTTEVQFLWPYPSCNLARYNTHDPLGPLSGLNTTGTEKEQPNYVGGRGKAHLLLILLCCFLLFLCHHYHSPTLCLSVCFVFI